MDRTEELLARLDALASKVAAQEAVIAQQGAELTRLRVAVGAGAPLGGDSLPGSRAATPSRRGALRRLALGAGAAAVGLLAAARPERAEAGANVTDTGES